MLVLSRKMGETVVIDSSIQIVVVGVSGGKVRLGIEAPSHVGILRKELCTSGRIVERVPFGSR